MDRCCGTCVWYEVTTRHKNVRSSSGYCCYAPPQQFVVRISDDSSAVTTDRPATRGYDRCHKYEAIDKEIRERYEGRNDAGSTSGAES